MTRRQTQPAQIGFVRYRRPRRGGFSNPPVPPQGVSWQGRPAFVFRREMALFVRHAPSMIRNPRSTTRNRGIGFVSHAIRSPRPIGFVCHSPAAGRLHFPVAARECWVFQRRNIGILESWVQRALPIIPSFHYSTIAHMPLPRLIWLGLTSLPPVSPSPGGSLITLVSASPSAPIGFVWQLSFRSPSHHRPPIGFVRQNGDVHGDAFL